MQSFCMIFNVFQVSHAVFFYSFKSNFGRVPGGHFGTALHSSFPCGICQTGFFPVWHMPNGLGARVAYAKRVFCPCGICQTDSPRGATCQNGTAPPVIFAVFFLKNQGVSVYDFSGVFHIFGEIYRVLVVYFINFY